jgi:hypothetical protein
MSYNHDEYGAKDMDTGSFAGVGSNTHAGPEDLVLMTDGTVTLRARCSEQSGTRPVLTDQNTLAQPAYEHLRKLYCVKN